jgi:hypothetical protein
MTEHLEEIEPVAKTRMADCLTELAGRMRRREIVMIFSDFFTDLDSLESPLQRLRYNRHEVVLFQVLHPDELEFDLAGQVKFLGLEEPEEYLTQPGDLRRAYLEALGRFNAHFEDLCQRNRVERVLVSTGRGLAEVFVDYLNQRSLLNRGR